MNSGLYSSVLLDAQGRFSPSCFVRVFLEAVEREGVPYTSGSSCLSSERHGVSPWPNYNSYLQSNNDAFYSPTHPGLPHVSQPSFSASTPHSSSLSQPRPSFMSSEHGDPLPVVSFLNVNNHHEYHVSDNSAIDSVPTSCHPKYPSAKDSASPQCYGGDTSLGPCRVASSSMFPINGPSQSQFAHSELAGLEAVSDEEEEDDDDDVKSNELLVSPVQKEVAERTPSAAVPALGTSEVVHEVAGAADTLASTPAVEKTSNAARWSLVGNSFQEYRSDGDGGTGCPGPFGLERRLLNSSYQCSAKGELPSKKVAMAPPPAAVDGSAVSFVERTNSLPVQAASAITHKLKLVLDLDNTLLHACAQSKLCNVDIPLVDFELPSGEPELYKFRLSNMMNQLYYVKFRPGLRRFLFELSHYCDLGIHTNATHEYADVIVAILDPDYSLFQGRVVAREDETTKDHKKNMDRLFRVDDLDLRSLVILDDRKDVWDDMYHPNIIKCGMYDYLDARKAALIEKYQEPHQSPKACGLTSTASNSAECVAGASATQTSTVAGVSNVNGAESNRADILSTSDVAALVPPVAPAPVSPLPPSPGESAEPLCSALSSTEPMCSTEGAASMPVPIKTPLPLQSMEAAGSCTELAAAPFLDNPLVEQSTLGYPEGVNEADNCEDDDVIAPHAEEDAHEEESEMRTVATANGEGFSSSIAPESTGKPFTTRARTAEDRLYDAQRSELAALYGVKEECVTDSMRSAAQLSKVDQALIDFDSQLDEIRKLIVDIATQYNQLKSSPVTAETASVTELLADRRKVILQGLVVQTAGMYKSETSHPEFGWHDNGPVHRRRLVRLGAQVVESLVPELTHIVAMRATQTVDRVRRERGVEVEYVHALWLHACESTWRRVPEAWFPALPLLRKYNNTPPMKPWVDHWRLLALHEPTPNSRLRYALKKARLPVITSAESTAVPEAEPTVVEEGTYQTVSYGSFVSNSDVDVRPSTNKQVTTIEPGSVQRRDHLVISSQSAGAQVWSAREFITLVYDPAEAARLKQRLQRTSSLNDTNASAIYNQQEGSDRADRTKEAASLDNVAQQSFETYRTSDFSNQYSKLSIGGWGGRKRYRFGLRSEPPSHRADTETSVPHRWSRLSGGRIAAPPGVACSSLFNAATNSNEKEFFPSSSRMVSPRRDNSIANALNARWVPGPVAPVKRRGHQETPFASSSAVHHEWDNGLPEEECRRWDHLNNRGCVDESSVSRTDIENSRTPCPSTLGRQREVGVPGWPKDGRHPSHTEGTSLSVSAYNKQSPLHRFFYKPSDSSSVTATSSPSSCF